MGEIDTKTRAKIASRAQAAAHKELREKYPEDYRVAYQAAKTELTKREEQRAGASKT